MDKDLISVIIPVYNVEKFLPYSLDSIINQKYKNMEIIVINDGSTDESFRICKEYEKKDKRIKVINQVNKGLSAARNAGIDIATGEYIGFIDSDDIISNEFFEQLHKLIVETKSDIAECASIKISENDVFEGKYQFDDIYYEKNYIINNSDGALHRLHNEDVEITIKSVVVWNKLYKKTLFSDIRFPEGKRYEDDFTTYKILKKINRIVSTDRVLHNYVQRNNSIMHQEFSIKRLDALEVFDNYIDAFKNHKSKYLFNKCLIRYLRVLTAILDELCNSKYDDKKEIKNLLEKRFFGTIKLLEENKENLEEKEQEFIEESMQEYTEKFSEILKNI